MSKDTVKAPTKFKWDDGKAEFVKNCYAKVPGEVRRGKAGNQIAMANIATAMNAEYGVEDVNYRKVIAKLTQLGVYEKPEESKPVAKRDEGPTKNQIIAAMVAEVPAFGEVEEGFAGTSKPALRAFAEHIGIEFTDS